VRAGGVELLGEVAGSGYRRPPSLVRRADGQILQLTPVLYAVLECIDGRRDVAGVARAVTERHGLVIDPEDIAHLVEVKLRPLGVVGGDGKGAEAPVATSNPLLALRFRFVVSNPAVTRRIARPFTGLFAPGAVFAVLVAFAAVTGWLLFEHGLASAARQALYEPGLLLVVVGLSLLSAGFHEVGHAAACVRAGAAPGAMGAGLYLLWPAFYTDVSDSYRLPRHDRLRVDLGGLYFNAVFAVGVFVVWAVTGADALLVIIPVQLLQMVRQLTPFVRFDGYHVLADLTGVPDLFARIKPTLLGLLPSQWGQPDRTGLKRWARVVITTWVLVVVPILAVSLVLMVVAFPRLAATTWDSLRLQAELLVDHWSHGRLARAGLGLFSVVAIALPVLSMTYLLSRVGRRSWRRAWSATADRPARRAALVALVAGAILALGVAWWPDGQYRPIDARDRGVVLDALPARSGPGAVPAIDVDGAGSAEDGALTAAAPEGPVGWGATSWLAGERSGAGARARHTFTPPRPPGDGDNQALAVGYDDGGAVYDMAPSLVWDDGDTVDNRNQAYALASCTDCTTVAVAFQVVLMVGEPDEVAPVNEAVAVNHTCVRCSTTAISMQTALSLSEAPTDAEVARVEAIWSTVDDVAADLPTIGPAAAYTRLLEVEGAILGLLGPDADQLASDHDVTDAPPGTEADPATTGAGGTTGATEPGSSDGTTDGSADDGTGDGTSDTTDTASDTDTTTSTTEPPPTTTTTSAPDSTSTSAA
jgi:putative peptide zinc metalloprotease protein